MAVNGNGTAKPPKASGKARIVRPLGGIEKMQSALHVTRQMCSTLITCRYAIPRSIRKPESSAADVEDAVRNTVFDAIAQTVLEHPLLLVGQINEDSAQPSWVRLDSINLEDHVTWRSVGKDEDYNTIFHERTQWSLDTWFTDLETKPGWRITIFCQEEDLTYIDLIFSWNHAHLDGMGGKIFHETLLRQLNAASNPDTHKPPPYLPDQGRVLEVPSVLNLPPPQEKLAKHPISAKFTSKTLWQELKPPFIGKKSQNSAFWCPIREDTHRSLSRRVTVGPETTSNLLVACRKNKTTLTGLMHGLCLVSLALQLDDKTKAMAAGTPLDQRRFMPTRPAAYPWYEPQKALCNIVTILTHFFSAELVNEIRSKYRPGSSQIDILAAMEDTIWSAAAQVRKELQDRIDLGLKNDITGLMKFVGDWRKQFRDNAKKPRVCSWGITNIGVMNGGDGEWKITRALFQVPFEHTAGAFGLSCVSVKGGDLNVLVNWQDGVLDDSMGDKLASDLQVWLEHMGKPIQENGHA